MAAKKPTTVAKAVANTSAGGSTFEPMLATSPAAMPTPTIAKKPRGSDNSIVIQFAMTAQVVLDMLP